MDSISFQPTSGTPKNPIPLLQQRIDLLEGEVRTLHDKLLAARRELALLQGKDPQLALDELLAELKRLEKLRLERERELAAAEAPEKDASDAPATESKPKERQGHGPRQQPRLPVKEEVHELPADQRECKVCGGEVVPMGEQFEEYEEITVLERKYFKKVIKCRKYRCSCNSCVETAPGPLRLIPGGRYSLDFAVDIAVSKYLDHMPLERQVRMMARQGLEVTSQTLWDQIDALAWVVDPSCEALGRLVLEAAVLHADETRWPLLNGRAKSPWMVWSRSTPEIAHYKILSSKSAKAARGLFSSFEGIVVVDGYAVYEKLKQEQAEARAGPQMKLANCWAHALRKFRDIEENFPAACQRILKLIGQLYKIERQVPGPFPGNDAAQRLRLRLRQEESKPLLKKIRTWAETEVGLPRSELGKAVRYMLKRWPALTRFVDDPRIPLDNNAAERALRGPVVGRKNHYGSKSKRGTQVAAIFYTLLETAKLSGVEPAFYLRKVAERALRNPGTVTLPQDLIKP